jgi:signal transduction histidine kinase
MTRGDQHGGLRVGTRRELGLLIGIGFLVTVLIGLGAAFASRTVAQRQALEDSERMTERFAQLTVAPLWSGFVSDDPLKVEELDRAVTTRIGGGSLTEVTVWSAQGRVLYSNHREDIGKYLPPPEQLSEALAGRTSSDFQIGTPEADLPSVGAPEDTPTRSLPAPNRLVEVYTPLRVDGQPPMVFEAYFDYDQVDRLASRLLGQTLPLVLIPLLALQVVQIPIAVSLARRIRRHQHERSRLLEQALSVSERERLRFVADLHDGPLQELAGVSFVLGAVASTVVPEQTPALGRVQIGLQRSMRALRSLMTDLYPPDLRSGNLDQSIVTLAGRLRDEGLEIVLDLGKLPALSEQGSVTLYWTVRESLANVQRHARARTVRISLSSVDSAATGDQARVRLVVADDGVGFDAAARDHQADGPLGLRLLSDRLESLGGELVVTSALGHGTTVQAELPARATVAD